MIQVGLHRFKSKQVIVKDFLLFMKSLRFLLIPLHNLFDVFFALIPCQLLHQQLSLALYIISNRLFFHLARIQVSQLILSDVLWCTLLLSIQSLGCLITPRFNFQLGKVSWRVPVSGVSALCKRTWWWRTLLLRSNSFQKSGKGSTSATLSRSVCWSGCHRSRSLAQGRQKSVFATSVVRTTVYGAQTSAMTWNSWSVCDVFNNTGWQKGDCLDLFDIGDDSLAILLIPNRLLVQVINIFFPRSPLLNQLELLRIQFFNFSPSLTHRQYSFCALCNFERILWGHGWICAVLLTF